MCHERGAARLGLNDPLRSELSIEVERRSPYRVVDGRLMSEACEISVTEHCNFTCRSCSHLSPVSRKYSVSPLEVERDLALLAPHYQVGHVRLLGGEPLLHPRLVDVVEAVRRSNITRSIRVLTNGSLLGRMVPRFWAAVDEVHLSVYPGTELSESASEALRQQAALHRTALVIKRFDRFRETYAAKGTNDWGLVTRIFTSCQIAHVWRCHTVAEGYFFLCPQGAFLSSSLDASANRERERERNGLKISADVGFGQQLLEYLEREHPLPACRRCLGSVGRIFDHEQIPRTSWRQFQQHRTEELIDWNHLEQLEANPDAHNGCFVTVPQG